MYFIPRSGSNFLANEMRKTGKLGYPLEYFGYANLMYISKRLIEKENILNSLIQIRTSPNGVFGYKWGAIFRSNFKRMFDEFPCKKYNIFIDRNDKVRQAESYFIAQKYDDWLSSRDKYKEKVSRRDIDNTIALLEGIRNGTLEMIKADKRDCFIIIYEDLILYTDAIVRQILDFVGE